MAYLYDLTDTWNAAGTVFNAIRMNVTNTASAAGSKIVSLQVGATDRFTVDKDGNGYFSGTLQAVGSISSPNVYIGANSGTIGMQDNTASIMAYNATGSGGITNTLRFITGATERVRINGSGNVGIGTASPLAKLHLYDAAAPEVRLQIGTNTSQGLFSFYTGSSKEGGVGFYPVSAMMDISSGRSAGWGGTITLTTDTSERMRITSAGNVGIGTSSPGNKLSVVGGQINTVADDAYAIALNATTGNVRIYPYLAAYSGSALEAFSAGYAGNGPLSIAASILRFWTGGSERARIDSSGNLGIGTSSPATYSGYTTLDIDSATNGGLINIKKAGTTVGYLNGNSGMLLLANSTDLKLSATGANTVQFLTGSTERMRITSAGNVGIGTTAPNAQAHVSFSPPVSVPALGSGVGALALGPAANYGMLLGTVSDGSGYIQQQRFDSTSTVYPLALQPNGGNVGIGTSSPAAKLHVETVGETGTSLIVSAAAATSSRINMGIGVVTAGRPFIGTNTSTNPLEIGTRNASALILLTDTTERMRIDSSGNVGIGTTALSNKFTVLYTDASAWAPNSTIATEMLFNNGALNNASATTLYQVVYGDSTTGGVKVGAVASGSYSADFVVANRNGGTFQENLRLTSSGNVGIGTTSPGGGANDRQLTVLGSSSAQATFSGNSVVNNSVGATTSIGYIGTTSNHPFVFTTNNTERMRIDTSGNVGIGTSSPSQKLHVSGNALLADTNPFLQITRTSDFYYSQLSADGIAAFTNTNGSAPIIFKTAVTERARIDASGNLLVGSSLSATARLVVASTSSTGEMRIQGSGTNSFYGSLYKDNGTGEFRITQADGGVGMTFYTGSSPSERARIDSSGNLLVGTTALAPDSGFSFLSSGYTAECRMRVGHTTGTASGSAYAEFLYAAGTIGSITQNGTTAVAYNTSSDYRLKNINGPVTNSGAYIDALKPVQGSWKADGSRFIGLIAHEVQEVSETQIATGVKDGEEMQAMDYSAPELIANLIAEIQSLRARVAQLEGN